MLTTLPTVTTDSSDRKDTFKSYMSDYVAMRHLQKYNLRLQYRPSPNVVWIPLHFMCFFATQTLVSVSFPASQVLTVFPLCTFGLCVVVSRVERIQPIQELKQQTSSQIKDESLNKYSKLKCVWFNSLVPQPSAVTFSCHFYAVQ